MAFCFPFIQLLGVDLWVLLEALTHRKIEAKTEEVKMVLGGMCPPSAAAASRVVAQEDQTPESCLPGPVWSSFCLHLRLHLPHPLTSHPHELLVLRACPPSLHGVFAYTLLSAAAHFRVLHLDSKSFPDFSSQGSLPSETLPAHPSATPKAPCASHYKRLSLASFRTLRCFLV